MLQFLHNLITRDERGQGLAEYALILALIAVVVIAAVTLLGTNINSILSTIAVSIRPRWTQRFVERRPATAGAFVCRAVRSNGPRGTSVPYLRWGTRTSVRAVRRLWVHLVGGCSSNAPIRQGPDSPR